MSVGSPLGFEEFRLIRELILKYCGVVLTDDQRGFVERAADAAEEWVALGNQAAMNRYN